MPAQTAFISHGGGPLPLLGDPAHADLVQHLKKLGGSLITPSAIVVFSAHWEGNAVEITASEQPELIYDYYGFPEASYQIQYPVKGEPLLAQKIQTCLQGHNIASQLNPTRGLDHGVFVPLKIMYPEANIPTIQVSLLKSLDAASHIEIGKALQLLLDQNILWLGSGFSFHNLPDFFKPNDEQANTANFEFEAWLQQTLKADVDEQERENLLINWAKAPYARRCHPREEHLLPLFICYGLHQSACKTLHSINILNKTASTYIW